MNAELRAMIPSKRVLRGERGPRNWMAPYFSYMSNRDAGHDSTLPNVKRAGLAAAGRLSGYIGAYIDGCSGLCRPGLLNVSTEVHVFRTEAQASRFARVQAAAYRHLEGERDSKVQRFTSVELFEPRVFGEEAVGVRSESLFFGEETFTETLIMFRIRQVVGLSRAGNLNQRQYPDARVVALARILEERIRAVLAARGQ